MSLLSGKKYPSVLPPESRKKIEKVLERNVPVPGRADTLVELYRAELLDIETTLDMITKLQSLLPDLKKRRKSLLRSLTELSVAPPVEAITIEEGVDALPAHLAQDFSIQ
jgi:hypothetical protein